MILGILLTFQIIICVLLVATILMQKSEGGALGMGGGPSGFMTARGAGNLLTRSTAILATMFFVLSVALTIFGNFERGASSVVDRSKVGGIDLTTPAPAAPQQQQPAAQQPAAEVGPDLGALEAPSPQAGPSTAQPSAAAPASEPAPKK
jgi:preprotein translocase subunit SecG